MFPPRLPDAKVRFIFGFFKNWTDQAFSLSPMSASRFALALVRSARQGAPCPIVGSKLPPVFTSSVSKSRNCSQLAVNYPTKSDLSG